MLPAVCGSTLRAQDALSGEYGLTDMNGTIIAFGQIEVNAGTETYHAESLPPDEDIPLFSMRNDAAGYQPCDLDKGPGLPFFVRHPPGAAFIVFRGFVEGSIDELAGVVAYIRDCTPHGAAVHMHVEHVHEYGDTGAHFAVKRIRAFFDPDDSAVGGTDRKTFSVRNHPFGITEEVQSEKEEDKDDNGGGFPVQRGETQGAEREQSKQGKTFWGDGSGCGTHGYLQGKSDQACLYRKRRGFGQKMPLRAVSAGTAERTVDMCFRHYREHGGQWLRPWRGKPHPAEESRSRG